MNLYFAAANNPHDTGWLLKYGSRWMLFSYHYYDNKIDVIREYKKKFGITDFIDSGAFSAHTQGIKIRIKKYIQYIHDLQPDLYAVLDSIGDAEKTRENQIIMESEGLVPMPVFHMNEPVGYLDWYLERYDYIALGGMVMNPNLGTWLREVWEHIWRINPEVRIHGFGLTNQTEASKYPFCSIDSSSWNNGTRFATASIWDPKKEKIESVDAKSFFNSLGIDYETNDPIVGDLRGHIIKAGMNAYVEMNKWATAVHEKTDFSFLEGQGKMALELEPIPEPDEADILDAFRVPRLDRWQNPDYIDKEPEVGEEGQSALF